MYILEPYHIVDGVHQGCVYFALEAHRPSAIDQLAQQQRWTNSHAPNPRVRRDWGYNHPKEGALFSFNNIHVVHSTLLVSTLFSRTATVASAVSHFDKYAELQILTHDTEVDTTSSTSTPPPLQVIHDAVYWPGRERARLTPKLQFLTRTLAHTHTRTYADTHTSLYLPCSQSGIVCPVPTHAGLCAVGQHSRAPWLQALLSRHL